MGVWISALLHAAKRRLRESWTSVRCSCLADGASLTPTDSVKKPTPTNSVKNLNVVHEADKLQHSVQEQQQPWHIQQGPQMRARSLAEIYPPKALHKNLFDVEQIDTWFVEGFRDALASWRSSGDPRDIDLSRLPSVKREAPGVISFDCLTHELCDMLYEETVHYRVGGMPQRAPNSMNNYGLVLNEVGMRPVFTAILERYLSGVGARLFGDDVVRQSELHGQDLCVDDWGGSSLSSHHTFVVRYRPDEDRHLDMHVDDCDVTFNFGLMSSDDFTGSDLAFCGMKGSAERRRHLHTYKHVKGRCVVHSGKRRHGALDIETGERASLIMWTKSDSYRWTPDYQLKVAGSSEAETLPPDVICLSYTHDYDYDKWLGKLTSTGKTDNVQASFDSKGAPVLPML